jgi:hypothetical protein
VDVKKGVAIEGWASSKRVGVEGWLLENFGEASEETWFVDYDYDLFTLVMSAKIYTWYTLRWA